MKTRMLMLFSASALALAGCGSRDETANSDMANLDANMAAEGNLAIDNAAVASTMNPPKPSPIRSAASLVKI